MIYLNWHAWKSNNQWLLSDESVKKLYQFNVFDDMINWLWLNGNKEAARYFNKLNKG